MPLLRSARAGVVGALSRTSARGLLEPPPLPTLPPLLLLLLVLLVLMLVLLLLSLQQLLLGLELLAKALKDERGHR